MIKSLFILISFFAFSIKLYSQQVDSDSLRLEQLVSVKLEANHLSLFSVPELFGYKSYIEGDFLGDGLNEIVLLAKDSTDLVRLIMISSAEEDNRVSNVYEKISDYSFVGMFEKVAKGEVLWSNWLEGKGDDGLREFKDVPQSEQVVLDYDAIYMHAGESCGGGFVYWKDDQWNWLQQE